LRYNTLMDTRITRCLCWLVAFGRAHADRAPDEIRPLVRRKIAHTMRVLAHVRHILAEERPGKDPALAAEIAAILHDAGRFPQLADRRTFDDRAGYDHGEEGARILAGADVLDGLDRHWRETVIQAVRLHNRGVLPEVMDPDARTVTEMVRDADKLDAVRNSVNGLLRKELTGRAIKYGITVHPTEVSPDTVRRTRERKLVPYASMRWSNDFVLFLCAWIHDLHFPYAYNRLIDTGHFEQLLALLPDQGVFPELKEQLRADLFRLAGRERSVT
jgi:HD superfamily phosphohydrolase YqeK